MSSSVEVVNLALRRLGAARITSFSDGTLEANLARDTYAELRDELLRQHLWNFATRRTTLAASAETPSWGFTRQFLVPSDLLRLREVDGGDLASVAMESHPTDGRVFVSDLPAPLRIVYVARVEDENQMDASFRRALAMRCALEWAQAITGTTTIVQQLAAEFAEALRSARTTDGQEDAPAQFRSTDWTDARI